MDETNDALLRTARKRASFRKSIYYYVGFNLIMWAIWWFTVGHITGFIGYPWPVWLMLGWGVALIRQYFDAYKKTKE